MRRCSNRSQHADGCDGSIAAQDELLCSQKSVCQSICVLNEAGQNLVPLFLRASFTMLPSQPSACWLRLEQRRTSDSRRMPRSLHSLCA